MSIIVENTDKTLVFTWGRMNPPTRGHFKLIRNLLKIAVKNKAHAAVYLTKTQDNNKNPLSYEDKLYYSKVAFGKVVRHTPARDIFELLEAVEKNFKKIIMVVGSDRVGEFEELLNNYNGNKFNFQSIRVVSGGDRDPDSGDSTEAISGTKVRNFAVLNEFEAFQNSLPAKLKPLAKEIFNKIRQTINTVQEQTYLDTGIHMKSFLEELDQDYRKQSKKPIREDAEANMPIPMNSFEGRATPMDVVSQAIAELIHSPLADLIDNPEALKEVLIPGVEFLFGSKEDFRDAWRIWSRLSAKQKDQAFNIAVDMHRKTARPEQSPSQEPMDDMELGGGEGEDLPMREEGYKHKLKSKKKPVKENFDAIVAPGAPFPGMVPVAATNELPKMTEEEEKAHDCVIDLITKVTDLKMKMKDTTSCVHDLNAIQADLVKVAKMLKGGTKKNG